MVGYGVFYGSIKGFHEIDGTPGLQKFWAFLVLFIISLLVLSIVRFIVTVFVSSIGISGKNHFLGMILAFLKSALIIYICVMIIQNLSLYKEDGGKKSIVIKETSPYLLFSPGSK